MKTKTQDPKFYIEDNRLISQSGVVPSDEPLFILRARDNNAVKTLLDYLRHCVKGGAEGEHIQAIALRLCEFTQFRNDHPDRMKIPDTSVKELHDGKPPQQPIGGGK